jgi:divalent metal cation (Fe/Co/Zn/Cd) transporter
MGYSGPWHGPSYTNHWYDPILAFVSTVIIMVVLWFLIKTFFAQ